MDEGKIILQSVLPWDANRPESWMRHRLFIQQCQSLLQVARWLSEGRVSVDGCRVLVHDASFNSFQFSPALDYPEAIHFTRPDPHSVENIPNRQNKKKAAP
jgi:phosphoribosylglycinamide formyltransferase-1